MKVILKSDVNKLGKAGSLLEVSDGYARNFILKKKLGLEANSTNLNNLKLQKANDEKVAKEILEKAKEFGEDLADKTPIAKDISRNIVCLPIYAHLSLTDVDKICDIILE